MSAESLKSYDLLLRVKSLEERVALLEKATKTNNSGPVDMMIRDKEYDRVCEEMRLIRSTYGDHQTWIPGDAERYRVLRSRRNELRKILGVTV